MDCRVTEVSYSAVPIYIGDKLYYKYLIKNPYSEKKIEKIEFVPLDGADWTVDVKEIKVL